MNWILKRLRRITLTTTYLPEIDGLRFIAISAVVFCHLSADLVLRHGLEVQAGVAWISTLAAHSERGVQLFFTISGFILGLPFAKRYLSGSPAPDLKRYFRRRLFRLEPPYLLNVVVLTIATWFAIPGMRPSLIWHFLTAISYTHLLVFHYVNPINMIWWSLEIETQFYVLMPLLALVFIIRNSWLRRGILIVAALTTFLWQGMTPGWIISNTILFNIQFFLVGLLAADLYHSNTFRKRRSAIWDCLGVGACVGLFALPDWWRIPAPVLTLVLILSALNGNLFSRFLSLPWISAVGGMCYTIYLWHVFVMAIALKFTLKFVVVHSYLLTMLTQAVIVVPAIFFSSVALFLLVEKPCMEPEWPSALRRFLRERWARPVIEVPAAETE